MMLKVVNNLDGELSMPLQKEYTTLSRIRKGIAGHIGRIPKYSTLVFTSGTANGNDVTLATMKKRSNRHGDQCRTTRLNVTLSNVEVHC